MISTVSLIFAEVVGVDGTVAVCRPCQGDWCPVRGDELRYIIDDTAQDIRIQARVADKWLDVQRGGSSDYIWQEPTPAVAEIRSLKTHNIAVLEDEDGSRHGLVLSGITTSAEGGGPGPSIWFDPEVFHR
jgi:hypothetical protein